MALTSPTTPAERPVPGPTAAEPVRPSWPALDGLRALAVMAVLAYHGGFSWAQGGYLGVSTFFTLSGFLITTLLVGEHRRSRRIDRRDFLARRARRLLPAALAGLAVVVVFGFTVATADQQRNLFGDVATALTYCINWRFILQGRSYAQLFTAPSPLQHFWSLAIEGQFYLVFPFVAAWALGGGRDGRGRSSLARLGTVVGSGMAASLALTLLAGYGHDRIYYGTDTRAFELLAGAGLAVLLAQADRYRRSGRTGDPAITSGSRSVGSSALGWAGPVALVACVWLWATVGLSTGWLYRGGLSAYSLLSVAVVASIVVVPHGLLSRLLSWRPLRAIGLVSYGLYVFHWPIFLWLTPARTHLAVWPDFGLRLAVTGAVAAASYRWIEVPVRTRRWSGVGRSHAMAGLGVAVAAAVLVASSAISVTAPAAADDFAAAQRALAHPRAPVGPTGDRPTVGWFGDSTGLVLAEGSVYDAGKPLPIVDLGGEARLGCGVGPGGDRRLTDGEVVADDQACTAQLAAYGSFVDQHRPDLAVVLFGPNDLYDRKIPGVCASWCHIGSAPDDRWLDHQMLQVVDTLSRSGALVVWLTSPPMPVPVDRTRLFDQMIERLPAQRPGEVVVEDLDHHLQASGRDRADRPDGVHLSADAAVVVGQGWLDPALAALWRTRR